MSWYADFFARRRGVVAALVAVLSALALLGVTRLGFDDVPRGIFAGAGEESQRLDAVFRDFGADDNDAVLLLETDDWITPEGVALLREASTRVRSLPGVELAAGPADVLVFATEGSALRRLLPAPLLPAPDAAPAAFERARALARTHPLVAGRLLSDDRTSAIVLARFDRALDEIDELTPSVDALRALAAELSSRAGVTARVTGVPAVRVDIYRLLPREQVTFLAAGALICTLLAFLIFRDARAVVATMVGPVIGAFWAVGFCGLVGRQVDLLSAVLPELAIVIGFTDSVHLMIDARAARARGVGPLAAAVDAIRHLGPPCLLTSITTGIGFGSLWFADVPIIQRFGLLAAVAVTLTFVSVLTTLPLVVSWMHALGGRRPRAVVGGGWGGFVARAARKSVARPALVVSLGVATTLACLALAARLEPENRLTEAVPRTGDTYLALRDAEAQFGGLLPAYVLVEWPPGEAVPWALMEQVVERIDAVPGAHVPLSPANLAALVPGSAADPAAALALLPGALVERLWRPDLGRALVTFQVPDGDHATVERVFGGLRASLAELSQGYPDATVNLTGTDVVARAQINRMILELAKSLALAVLVIFALLALEFRSLWLGFASLLPNVFPLACVAGLLVVLGYPLQMSSAVLFTILLGLAVDDTIHLLARYRREGGRKAGREGVVRATAAVGEAIGFTTLVLVAGFGVVVFSAVPTNQLFAVLTCVGLVAALVGDLVLLPALLALRARRFD